MKKEILNFPRFHIKFIWVLLIVSILIHFLNFLIAVENNVLWNFPIIMIMLVPIIGVKLGSFKLIWGNVIFWILSIYILFIAQEPTNFFKHHIIGEAFTDVLILFIFLLIGIILSIWLSVKLSINKTESILILVDAYNTLVTDEGIFMEMHILLEKFPNRKIILTNADEEKQRELGLVNLPYEMFTQSFNPLKTDLEYYKNFLKDYNLEAKDVIYFEHDEKAVESAKSMWINTFHYNKDTKDLESLEKFLRESI